jgi:hypothetical protein
VRMFLQETRSKLSLLSTWAMGTATSQLRFSVRTRCFPLFVDTRVICEISSAGIFAVGPVSLEKV